MKKIKVGASYITKNEGDHFAGVVMTALKIVGADGISVEESGNADAIVHWRSVKRMHNKINQTGRVWWFQEYCLLIDPLKVRPLLK